MSQAAAQTSGEGAAEPSCPRDHPEPRGAQPVAATAATGVFPSGECVQDSEEPAIQAKAGLECKTGWADLTLGPA